MTRPILARDVARCEGHPSRANGTDPQCSRRHNCRRFLDLHAREYHTPVHVGMCSGEHYHNQLPIEVSE